MIIYKITNLVNKKIYIGKTTNTLAERWSSHLYFARDLKKKTVLALAIRKYGPENFKIEQIDTASNEKELNIKEWFYAEILNSYAPNGYNLTECGEGMKPHQDTIDKRTKERVMISPSGELIKIKNLSRFCRENNLLEPKMNQVANNKKISYMGWRSGNVKNKVFVIKNIKSQQEIRILDVKGEIKNTAQKINVSPERLAALIRGSVQQTSDWILLTVEHTKTIDDNAIERTKKKRSASSEDFCRKMTSGDIKRLLNNNDMKIYEFTNISRFVKQFDLQMALVLNILNGGNRAKHKRWSLPNSPIKKFLVRNEANSSFVVFDGEIKKFCRENGIKSSERFFFLLNGKVESYKGWKLIKVIDPMINDEIVVLDQYKI